MKQHSILLSSLTALVFSSALCLSVQAQDDASGASNWSPVASETLLKLPANIMEKRIEQEFSMSPMATQLVQADGQLQQHKNRIDALKRDLSSAASEVAQDIKFELVKEKSAYLDVLHESHALRKQLALQKQQVYEDVLAKLRHQSGSVSASEQFKLREKQQAARQRMEKVMSNVDQTLMHTQFGETSRYGDEYAANLAQIEKLKAAIARHDIGQQPVWNGEVVTSEEYIRQLMVNSAQDFALLDQEGLILSYMSRLVALDAQALEYELAYGETAQSPNFGGQTRQAVDAIL
ncbi:hypothetical protein [Planctobacterium marinum]|uniref:Uncharacterized protein n=1 Tax=Planctobacterium marinum TaxID=1631968 RepID=A0AA48HKF0_9ALTE|nr:hypothetical protein MACH26_19070 [Planctobacterium marinum]